MRYGVTDMEHLHDCQRCGRPFSSRRSDAKYCSIGCRKGASRDAARENQWMKEEAGRKARLEKGKGVVLGERQIEEAAVEAGMPRNLARSLAEEESLRDNELPATVQEKEKPVKAGKPAGKVWLAKRWEGQELPKGGWSTDIFPPPEESERVVEEAIGLPKDTRYEWNEFHREKE